MEVGLESRMLDARGQKVDRWRWKWKWKVGCWMVEVEVLSRWRLDGDRWTWKWEVGCRMLEVGMLSPQHNTEAGCGRRCCKSTILNAGWGQRVGGSTDDSQTEMWSALRRKHQSQPGMRRVRDQQYQM